MTPLTELDRLFAASLAATPKPEAPMYYESPDLGNPDQERSSGTIDVNEVTWPENVAEFRAGVDKLKRDRNATPRRGGDEPEAA